MKSAHPHFQASPVSQAEALDFSLIIYQLVSFMLDLQGEPMGLSFGGLDFQVPKGTTSQLPVKRLSLSIFVSKLQNNSTTNVECLSFTI